MGLSYFENCTYTICGLVMMLLLLLIAYTKRQTAKVRYRFVVIYIVTLLLLIVELFCPYAIMIKDTNKFVSTIIMKAYLILLYTFTLQLFLVASKVCSKNNKEFNGKKLIKYEAYVIGYTAVLILSVALGADYIIKDGQPLVIRGTVLIAHNVISAVISALELIMLIKANKPVTKFAAKIFATGLVLYILVLLFESVLNYYVTISGAFYALLMFITYCTIESQDFVRYTQVEEEIKNLSNSNKQKNESLNKLYYSARTEVSLILDYTNLIEEDDTYSDAQIQELSDIVRSAANNLDTVLTNTKESE